ncbi:YraN family protein [Elioraea sp.]|uniref:YraN family protein n=1 Tax=Elioraea sp. TaxID=2185103 RepID=UPI0025BDFFC1|nr:YraN family protein [Elioraea sp.]
MLRAMDARRQGRGRAAEARGLAAEATCAAVLVRAGFAVLGRRVRTGAGEIDLVARHGDLTIIVEVKARPGAAEAAFAISPRQRTRLVAATEALMAKEPGWFGDGLRFDAMFVAGDGAVHWLEDAFRPGD